MKEHKNFWDKNAGRYDRFMQKDRAAYDEMYVLIRPVVKAKTVPAVHCTPGKAPRPLSHAHPNNTGAP